MNRPKTPISHAINSVWGDLTFTDRKVGRVLLANYPMAGMRTLAAVSEQANVSSPTVMRFVKKLGFDGYPEFQKALHQEIALLLDDRHRVPEPAESLRHLPERVTGLCTQFVDDVQRTFSLLQAAELAGAARLLADASSDVSVLGGAVSAPLAHSLYRRLMLLRPKCAQLSTDPLERTEKLMTIGKRDTLVAFDPAPCDPDLNAFTRLAAEQGAQVILFTDGELSPIAENARFVFTVSAQSGAHSVATTCLLETLLAEVQQLIGRSADLRLRQLRGAYS